MGGGEGGGRGETSAGIAGAVVLARSPAHRPTHSAGSPFRRALTPRPPRPLVPALPPRSARGYGGRPGCITLTLCPLVRASIRAFYCRLRLLCAQLLGTASDCTCLNSTPSPGTSTSRALLSHADISADSLSLASAHALVPYCKASFIPPVENITATGPWLFFQTSTPPPPEFLILLVVFNSRFPDSEMYSDGIELACQKQKEFVKSSVACKWNLAEAQQKLGSLALHNSESLDQEHAKAQTAVSELRQREEEWRQKEEALVQRERMCLWNMDAISKDVFNKSFINQDKRKTEDEDKSQSFMQKYEQKIRHFGMLSRWDDSQRFLSDHPYLVCEETAKYLILWCFHLEAEQKGALMEQIAHQAVVMQFIMEMAKNSNVDPRGCFRLFFQKAKAEEEGYFEAFKNELEAFKSRVRLYAQSQSFQPVTVQNHVPHSGVGCIGSLEPLSQNPDYLQYSINTPLCSLNSVVHKEDDDKMMDTV